MKRILFLVLVIGATVMMLSSCQKDVQTAPLSVKAITQSQANGSTANGYGGHFIYNIELSANISGTQGGGLWIWIGLHSDGTGDYSGADCGHGGAGATNDKGDVTWHLTGVDNASIEIDGVVLNGLGGFPSTFTVPSTYGHYTGTIGTFETLPGFIPPFIGTSQLTVAH